MSTAPEVDRLRAELAAETRRAEDWRAQAEALQARLDVATGQVERYKTSAYRWRSLMEAGKDRIAELLDAQAAQQPDAPEPAAETPAEPESPLVDVDPDSPAGRVAAQLGEQLAGHIGPFSQYRVDGRLLACPIGDELAQLRAVARLLPDAKVEAKARDKGPGAGWLDISIILQRDSIPVWIGNHIGPRRADEQAAFRTWLAEIGVEVGAR